MPTLEQFLRSGELGPIRFGMTYDEVVEVLGNPVGWGGSSDRPYKSYGGLLLTFGRNGIDSKLRLVHIDLYYEPNRGGLPERVRPTDWTPRCETTEVEFLEFIHRIGLTVENRIPGDSGFHLYLPTGARVAFSNNTLYSMHFSAKRAPMKQISFTVSADTFAAIREQAERSNQSVSALCADWVTERVGSPLAAVG
jgi:hypothetical protein